LILYYREANAHGASDVNVQKRVKASVTRVAYPSLDYPDSRPAQYDIKHNFGYYQNGGRAHLFLILALSNKMRGQLQITTVVWMQLTASQTEAEAPVEAASLRAFQNWH